MSFYTCCSPVAPLEPGCKISRLGRDEGRKTCYKPIPTISTWRWTVPQGHTTPNADIHLFTREVWFPPLLKWAPLTSKRAGQCFVKYIPQHSYKSRQFNIFIIAGRRIMAVTWFDEISRQCQAKEVGIIPPHYLQTIILFHFEHATYQKLGQ